MATPLSLADVSSMMRFDDIGASSASFAGDAAAPAAEGVALQAEADADAGSPLVFVARALPLPFDVRLPLARRADSAAPRRVTMARDHGT